jgi:hypothetical protein
MSSLQIDHPGWFSPSKILGSAQIGVLTEAAFQVCGDPCIEGIVRAENNINLPIHHFPAISPDNAPASTIPRRHTGDAA